jgi:hypothetical protein
MVHDGVESLLFREEPGSRLLGGTLLERRVFRGYLGNDRPAKTPLVNVESNNDE